MKKEIALISMILALLFVPLSKAAFAAEEKKVCVKSLITKPKKKKKCAKLSKSIRS